MLLLLERTWILLPSLNPIMAISSYTHHGRLGMAMNEKLLEDWPMTSRGELRKRK
jgi:hypothetical protein